MESSMKDSHLAHTERKAEVYTNSTSVTETWRTTRSFSSLSIQPAKRSMCRSNDSDRVSIACKVQFPHQEFVAQVSAQFVAGRAFYCILDLRRKCFRANPVANSRKVCSKR